MTKDQDATGIAGTTPPDRPFRRGPAGSAADPLSTITQGIVETYEECGAIHHLGHSPLPSYREVVDILADLREILYPGYGRRQNLHMGNVAYHVGDLVDSLYGRLTQQIARAFRYDCHTKESEADLRVEGGGAS